MQSTSPPAPAAETRTPVSQEPNYAGPGSLRLPGPSPRIPRACWVVACLLAALAQMALAGYQMGVGNQTIQIPFLKRAMDSTLYSRDAMVTQTINDYPSFFYPVVARIVKVWQLLPAYFWLHLLTTFAVLSFLFALTRGMFRTARDAYLTAAVAVALVLAGHHHALAGDELYSGGFTHTYAVLPLAIAALALAYRDRLLSAWVVTGILFNFHALTAAYLAAPLAVLTLMDWRLRGWKYVLSGPVAGGILALPTLVVMATHRQTFDALWVTLTYVRSADHSFPSYWWRQGAPEVPRFALLMALAGLSFTFAMGRRVRRTSLVFAGVTALLFVAGYVFSEIYPVPTVLRAQLFRASRLLLVLAIAHIAHGIVEGIFACIGAVAGRARGGWKGVAAGVLEGFAAIVTLCVVASPALTILLPYAVVLVTLAALVSGRLHWLQSVVVAGALLVAVAAWKTIGFAIPGTDGDFVGTIVRKYMHAGEPKPFTWISLGALIAAILLLVLPRLLVNPKRQVRSLALVLLMAAAGMTFFGFAASAQFTADIRRGGSMPRQDAWLDVQRWAKASTPKESLFVTPPQTDGFRIFSERSVVSEWRDGTQLYFTGKFAKEWWDRYIALRPNTRLDGRKMRPGQLLGDLSDEELLAVAQHFKADYLVLPAKKGNRKLKEAYRNTDWVVFEPEIPHTEKLAYSKGVWKEAEPGAKVGAGGVQFLVEKPSNAVPAYAAKAEPYLAQDAFMREVVLPNIEKYRKSNAVITIVDESDRPVADAAVSAIQTSHRFDFGVSLPFFEPVDVPAPFGDYKPSPVKPVELERFKQAGFNFSMIPFSAKWQYLEPEEGKTRYSELDKYINWCVENGAATEFHFVTGLGPMWLPQARPDRPLTPADIEKVKSAVMRHAREIATRYGNKVKYYQVMNDWHPRQLTLENYAPELFAEIRKLAPEAKLGLSDCARLTSSVRGAAREEDLCRGIGNLKRLQAKGVKVDYFAPHAHQPYGLWPDAAEMYEAFDTWAKAGVKVHITEAFVPMSERSGGGGPGPRRFGGGPPGAATRPAESRPAPRPAQIYGAVRKDTWNRQLQAEHFERFLTICFSHPDVEAVNLWSLGPESRMVGEGILDEKFDPTPAFGTIRQLLHETFVTKVATTSAIDGKVSFRGFHGDYDLTVALPDGTVAKGRLALEAGAATTIRLKVNREKKTLELVK